MAPPRTVPSSLNLRYLIPSVISANLEAMPKMAAIIIQNRAPGPPTTIAVATPAIFPEPTMAETLVMAAWKEVSSPFAGFSSSFFLNAFTMVSLNRKPKCVNWKNPSLIVKYNPVARISTRIGTPQTMPLTKSLTFTMKSMFLSPPLPRKTKMNRVIVHLQAHYKDISGEGQMNSVFFCFLLPFLKITVVSFPLHKSPKRRVGRHGEQNTCYPFSRR